MLYGERNRRVQVLMLPPDLRFISTHQPPSDIAVGSERIWDIKLTGWGTTDESISLRISLLGHQYH